MFGTIVYFRDSPVSELPAHAGYDFVVIDLEHTALGLDIGEDHVRAAQAAGVVVFVRGPGNRDKLINRVLYTGAAGIAFPHPRDRADAERAVSAVKYPLWGCRGMCRATRATGYREERGSGSMWPKRIVRRWPSP